MQEKAHPEKILKLIRESTNKVTIDQLSQELLAAFGGAKKFALTYVRAFNGSRRSTIVQARMLEGVLRAISNSKSNVAIDPSMLSDEELEEGVIELSGAEQTG